MNQSIKTGRSKRVEKRKNVLFTFTDSCLPFFVAYVRINIDDKFAKNMYFNIRILFIFFY